MATQHLVVDGSNVATETRQTPSLAQLEGALEELRKDFPDAEITVVVDATFAHRIDPSELARYEELLHHGELVSPPAGAIGRGDAFLLRIAEKVDGTVFSNDSFQEFHGEHPWLFERGRLLGATPVPGVGWIFMPRSPVRGPRSRVAVRDASRAKERVHEAIAEATREVEHPEEAPAKAEERAARTRTRRSPAKPQAVNDPVTFITFIADHKLGDAVDAEVESFTSHGAVIGDGEVKMYAPLANLGNPAPHSARAVLHRGERRTFVITALDPFRRGIELSLPGVAEVSGRPSEETVEAEVRLARRRHPQPDAPVGSEPAATEAPPEQPAPAPRRPRRAPKAPVAETSAASPASTDGAAAPAETPSPRRAREKAPSSGQVAAPTDREGDARAPRTSRRASRSSPDGAPAPAKKRAAPARGTSGEQGAKAPVAGAAKKASAAGNPAKKAPAAGSPAKKAASKRVEEAAPAPSATTRRTRAARAASEPTKAATEARRAKPA